MSLSIEVVWAQDCPKELKDRCDTYCDDDSNVMVVKHGDEIIRVVTDYMEPEDAIFLRSLNWIPDAIEEAYELGREDGKTINNRR